MPAPTTDSTPARLRRKLLLALGVAGLAIGSFAAAQTVSLAPVFVTATRGPEAAGNVAFSHISLTGDDLREAPNTTVDGALRAIPGFSLFRRTDSLVAHPTTQGVSLRGLGPSGASRTLVLLDGVPLNDPFGGWVLWSGVPRESLARIEVVPGGGGTAWGDAALGGTIQLFTEPVTGRRERLAARFGSFDTGDVELEATEPAGAGTLQILGRVMSTGGYYTIAPEFRGSIDRPARSQSRWLTARWREPIGKDTSVTLTVRRFDEDRGNGTPYTHNGTAESFASVEVAAQPGAAWQWTATAYFLNEGFSSTFSSVNAARTAETPASNQFDVPSTATGFAWVATLHSAADAQTSFGVDARDVRGETREDSGYVNGAFTRRRFAGGRQTTAGVFVEHSRRLPGGVRASVGLREDGWWDSEGHRRDYTSGAPTGDLAYPRQDGTAFSPSAGLVWPVGGAWRLHASAQQAFRRPTLNELYRPFRVGNVITDANPDLRTETVTGGEVGVDATWRALDLGVAAFANVLHDPVANVTIAQGPANIPGIGVVPAGGSAQRRLNLDRVRVQGVTLTAKWRLAPGLTLDAQYLLDDTEVTRATVAPQLVGRRLPQVPRTSATAGLAWRSGRWRIEPSVRWIGAQFDDDLNTQRLAPATVVDFSAGVTLGSGAELFASAENLFDRRIETGRPGGLVTTGTPRMWLVGLRLWR